MTIFNWNPIRQVSDSRHSREYLTEPTNFVPRDYVLQKKRLLYNNLFVLLAALWALTMIHEIDISGTDRRVKLKKVLASGSLSLSHLLAVPWIISKLHLHSSIILGAVGMGTLPLFYDVKYPLVLPVVICMRAVFEALFDVSTTVYVVKLARISSSIRGTPVLTEILTTRSLIIMFSSSSDLVAIWLQQSLGFPGVRKYDTQCNYSHLCPNETYKNIVTLSVLSGGQHVMYTGVATVVALSSIILIAMYLKPITNLSDLDLSREPRPSSTWDILKQFQKPKSIYLALLITSCVFTYSLSDEFVTAYVICHYSPVNTYFIVSMKQIAVVFGILSCVTLVDLTGCRSLYAIALCGQLLAYISLLSWSPTDFNTEISHIVVYYIVCITAGIKMSVLQLLVIQTINQEEVSAWCFFYGLGDVAYIMRLVSDMYFCTESKLRISIGIIPVAMIATVAYWHKFDKNVTALTLYGPGLLMIKTPKETLREPYSFDLRRLVSKPEDIYKVDTFLQRSYVSRSPHLVPPPDDKFSDT